MRIRQERVEDYLLANEAHVPAVRGDAESAVRVTEQRGYAWVDDHAHGMRVYCIRVERHGATVELIPKWFDLPAIDIDP